jgi:hypothetical protein
MERSINTSIGASNTKLKQANSLLSQGKVKKSTILISRLTKKAARKFCHFFRKNYDYI